MSTFESIPLSPFCVRLASKKLLLDARPPRTESDLLDASCHTWCTKTQESIGPDGAPTDPEDCRAGRSCFEPYS
ncbi:MAG TPA: hypothetical protein ENJ09_02565 [Planctomycetes bacterium]|nr:hypothetical protein [Planctomycetota bacterium]